MENQKGEMIHKSIVLLSLVMAIICLKRLSMFYFQSLKSHLQGSTTPGADLHAQRLGHQRRLPEQRGVSAATECAEQTTTELLLRHELGKFRTPAEGVIDAKALYDVGKKTSIGNISDTRTAVEVAMLKQRMSITDTQWRWVSSERQVADGMTKASVRALLAHRLRAAVLHISSDLAYTAAKKKTASERERSRRATIDEKAVS